MAMALHEQILRMLVHVVTAGLLAACGNAVVPPTSAGAGSGTARFSGELSAANRSVAREVDAEVAAPETKKFVRIEVFEVENPQKIPVSFHVYYHAQHEGPVLLGVFSLFPPDNPGTFIIATQGKLRRGGTVVVQLVPLESADVRKLRVRLGRISFAQE